MKNIAPSYGKLTRDFRTLALSQKKREVEWPLLVLDPGGTTGYCIFDDYKLVKAGQLPGTPEAVRDVMNEYHPQLVVMEEYRIRNYQLDIHTWSDMPVSRLIGAIELICRDANVTYIFQSAATAKVFATDEKLKAWGLYQRGKQHATDAIRHAVWYQIFGANRVQRKK